MVFITSKFVLLTKLLSQECSPKTMWIQIMYMQASSKSVLKKWMHGPLMADRKERWSEMLKISQIVSSCCSKHCLADIFS